MTDSRRLDVAEVLFFLEDHNTTLLGVKVDFSMAGIASITNRIGINRMGKCVCELAQAQALLRSDFMVTVSILDI